MFIAAASSSSSSSCAVLIRTFSKPSRARLRSIYNELQLRQDKVEKANLEEWDCERRRVIVVGSKRGGGTGESLSGSSISATLSSSSLLLERGYNGKSDDHPTASSDNVLQCCTECEICARSLCVVAAAEIHSNQCQDEDGHQSCKRQRRGLSKENEDENDDDDDDDDDDHDDDGVATVVRACCRHMAFNGWKGGRKHTTLIQVHVITSFLKSSVYSPCL